MFGPQQLPVVTADWFGLLVRVRGRQPDGETERGGDLRINGLLRFVCFLLHSLNLELRVPDFIFMSAQAKLFRHNKKQQIRYCHVRQHNEPTSCTFKQPAPSIIPARKHWINKFRSSLPARRVNPCPVTATYRLAQADSSLLSHEYDANDSPDRCAALTPAVLAELSL